MKRNILIIIILSTILIGCQQKSKQEASAADTTTEQNLSGNPYISDNQAEEHPAVEEDLSGHVIPLSADQFIEQITDVNNSQGLQYKGITPCIVDFYADWCGPCISIKPMMEDFAQKYKGKVIIYKINVDHAQEICKQLDISNIPTLVFFKRNEQPQKMVGAPSKGDLDKAIQALLK